MVIDTDIFSGPEGSRKELQQGLDQYGMTENSPDNLCRSFYPRLEHQETGYIKLRRKSVGTAKHFRSRSLWNSCSATLQNKPRIQITIWVKARQETLHGEHVL